jgi:CHASE2 domain-containing sensor protein
MIRTLLYIFLLAVIGIVLFGVISANAILAFVFKPIFWIGVLLVLLVMWFLERRGNGV